MSMEQKLLSAFTQQQQAEENPSLSSIKGKVWSLYIDKPHAMESDALLLDIFEREYSAGINMVQQADSIKRAGRYWRQEWGYVRSTEKRQIDVKYQRAVKDEFKVMKW